MINHAPFKLLHTTQKTVQETAADIMAVLGRMGANNISMDMENQQPTGMTFAVIYGDRALRFRLPIKWKPVFDVLIAEGKAKKNWHKGPKSISEKEADIGNQAKRTAWRMSFEWLKIQAAYVSYGAKTANEVFMSDMLIPGHEEVTLGQHILEGNGLLRLTSSVEREPQ